MILSIILQVILGLGFLMFGYQKFTSEDMKKGFEYFGYGDGFRLFTGSVEILSAIIIIIGIWIQPLAIIGSSMIVVTMLGAIMTHVKIKDEFKNMLMSIILLIVSAIILVIRLSM